LFRPKQAKTACRLAAHFKFYENWIIFGHQPSFVSHAFLPLSHFALATEVGFAKLG